MRRVRRLILLLFILSATAVPCLAEAPVIFDNRPDHFPEALILLPHAKNVRYYERGKIFDLTYEIVSDYPATETIKAISYGLEQKGWQALRDDHLNPGLPSSHVTGWQDFIDGARTPEQTVHQWLASWESKQGDVVTYGLCYEYEYGRTKDLHNLMVMARFSPADIANREREWALKDKKTNSKTDRNKWADSYDHYSSAIRDLDPVNRKKCETLLTDILKNIDDNGYCKEDDDCTLLKQAPFGATVPIRKDHGSMVLEKMSSYKESCDNGSSHFGDGVHIKNQPVCSENKCMVKSSLEKLPREEGNIINR